jgi:ribonuclease BN (tRNA processing enzyme)
VKISVLPIGSNGPQHTVAYIIDDRIAVDAGCLGSVPLEVQRKVSHVFLSHSHIDHMGTLPIFLDNVFGPTSQDAPHLYANESTWRVLDSDIFNERVWTDLRRIAMEEVNFFHGHTLNADQTVVLDGYNVLSLELNHVIPTFGYAIESKNGVTVAIISDTGSLDQVWDRLNQLERLDAVFLDIAFPNRMEWLADKSMHLCPRLVADEVGKLRHDVRWYAIHLKPAFFEEIHSEVKQDLPFFDIVEAGDEITIGPQ